MSLSVYHTACMFIKKGVANTLAYYTMLLITAKKVLLYEHLKSEQYHNLEFVPIKLFTAALVLTVSLFCPSLIFVGEAKCFVLKPSPQILDKGGTVDKHTNFLHHNINY